MLNAISTSPEPDLWLARPKSGSDVTLGGGLTTTSSVPVLGGIVAPARCWGWTHFYLECTCSQTYIHISGKIGPCRPVVVPNVLSSTAPCKASRRRSRERQGQDPMWFVHFSTTQHSMQPCLKVNRTQKRYPHCLFLPVNFREGA